MATYDFACKNGHVVEQRMNFATKDKRKACEEQSGHKFDLFEAPVETKSCTDCEQPHSSLYCQVEGCGEMLFSRLSTPEINPVTTQEWSSGLPGSKFHRPPNRKGYKPGGNSF